MTREPMTLAPLSRACAGLSPQVQSQSEWPLVLIRIYLSSGYFTSGMCKVLCGLRFSRYWGKGPTLQMYIYDSMWSRPAGPRIRALQQYLLCCPWLLTLLASGSVLFETSFILAPTSDTLCIILGLNGFVFHGGIKLLQGLDFVTWWSPALFAFLVGVVRRTHMSPQRTLQTSRKPPTAHICRLVCAAFARAVDRHLHRARARDRLLSPRSNLHITAGAHSSDAARLLARGHPPLLVLPHVHAAAQPVRRLAKVVEHDRWQMPRYRCAHVPCRLACRVPCTVPTICLRCVDAILARGRRDGASVLGARLSGL